ncbi:MAG TPA: MGMT family protein [Candidatus Saccharimonadales bacterium]|nr:MGMT family protein [Candidatus Saccharimonadales bacterium]
MKSPQTFKEKIYAIAKSIPKGKVATYGQLAALAGSPGAARAVGMCMKTNPIPEIVPCYRVVASDGSLTGYSAGEGIITKKEKLLKDGVAFNKDKVDLRSSQWKPAKEYAIL